MINESTSCCKSNSPSTDKNPIHVVWINWDQFQSKTFSLQMCADKAAQCIMNGITVSVDLASDEEMWHTAYLEDYMNKRGLDTFTIPRLSKKLEADWRRKFQTDINWASITIGTTIEHGCISNENQGAKEDDVAGRACVALF